MDTVVIARAVVSATTGKEHHRRNRCGRDFETGEQLRDHVERRHPERDVHWWVVPEDPARELQFSGR